MVSTIDLPFDKRIQCCPEDAKAMLAVGIDSEVADHTTSQNLK